MTLTCTTSRGVDLVYEDHGEGPPIAFVNSFLMPAAGWAAFTDELAEGHRLLTYDLGPAGWARTEVADFDSCVADLDELLDRVGLESAHLLGHSSGTQICVAYAAARPERVRSLVLVGPTVHPTGGVRRRELVAGWREAYLAGGFGGLFDALWPVAYSEVTLHRAGRLGRRLMRARFIEMNEGTDPLPLFAMSDTHQVAFTPDWSAITAPVLLLAGEDDAIATASALRETHELLPQARVAVVPRAGHVLYLEAGENFQREVGSFIDSVERRQPHRGRVC